MIGPWFSYRGEDTVRVLNRVRSTIGYPTTIRVDQGTDFASRDLDLVSLHERRRARFSRPRKPTANAFIEVFNGRFRVECLNQHWFMSLEDAWQKMEKDPDNIARS